MRVAKWGNSLALRIPADLVEELSLKPGQEVHIARNGKNGFTVVRDRSREEAIEQIRKMRFVVPADYKFNRDELYDE
jgi:antitoxin MazE